MYFISAGYAWNAYLSSKFCKSCTKTPTNRFFLRSKIYVLWLSAAEFANDCLLLGFLLFLLLSFCLLRLVEKDPVALGSNSPPGAVAQAIELHRRELHVLEPHPWKLHPFHSDFRHCAQLYAHAVHHSR